MSDPRYWRIDKVPRIQTPTQREGVEVSAFRGYDGGTRPTVAIDDSAILTPRGARRLARALVAGADFCEGKATDDARSSSLREPLTTEEK